MHDAPSTPIDAAAPSWLRRRRLAIAWVAILSVVAIANIATVHADARRLGRAMTLEWAIMLEGTSVLVLGAMLPAVYWFHRCYPVVPLNRNLLAHVAATAPFSLAHVFGMFALRWALAPLLGGSYPILPGVDALLYEYRKDAVTYLIISAALVALRHMFAERQAAPALPPSGIVHTDASGRLDRFAVRRKDKEVLVSAQDIAWIEAAGNYAILHVGGETYDIRSSLTRLEAELDPARFVRVHKSYIVNVARVREVEPWISGDSRLKLDDGAVVSLSRRYRERFEKIVPIRT
jgi:hypothetical protein